MVLYGKVSNGLVVAAILGPQLLVQGCNSTNPAGRVVANASTQANVDFAAVATAVRSHQRPQLPAFDASAVKTSGGPFTRSGDTIQFNQDVSNALASVSNGKLYAYAKGNWYEVGSLQTQGFHEQQVAELIIQPIFSFLAQQVFFGFFTSLGNLFGIQDVAFGPTFNVQGVSGVQHFLNYQIAGGAGNDTLYVDDQAGMLKDGGKISGGDGNDTLEVFGATGVVLDGGPGDDSMVGGAGNDTLEGGPGNDSMDGGPGDDSVDGGDGTDTVTPSDGSDTVTDPP